MKEQEANASEPAFSNAHRWFCPDNCFLSITCSASPPESQRSQATFSETSWVASPPTPFTFTHRVCQRKAGRGRGPNPQWNASSTGACASVIEWQSPFTSLSFPLLHCPLKALIKSSLGETQFLSRSLDHGEKSGNYKELGAAGQGWRPAVSGDRSPWLLQVLV